VRDICREACPDGARALANIVRDLDENGRNREDGRVVVVAVQTLFTWAYGKPPDYDPREDKPAVTIHTSHLSPEDRAHMLRILRTGVLREADPEPASETPEIEGQAEDQGR
jgi:hypothetical protein